MLQIIPFNKEHLSQIELQPQQIYMRQYFTAAYCEFLEKETSFSVINEAKAIIACGGFIQEDLERIYIWALLKDNIGKYMPFLHKKVLAYLKILDFVRIETITETNFSAGKRWLEMLGFTKEATLKHFRGRNQHIDTYAKYNL